MKELTPGFLVLHGNQQEQLRELLVDWIKRYPLNVLEQETLLVQSNGVAQWLQLALAADEHDGGLGIAAGLQLNLPGRFLWQAYRAVLGEQLPTETVFDKPALGWRIYRMLPDCMDNAVYLPLQHYLADDATQQKRYQLSLRLADLYDQYQIYRAEWLLDWEQGKDQISSKAGNKVDINPLADDQRWQAQLWRDLCTQLPEEQRKLSRPHVHQAFLQAARRLTAARRPVALPRRIVVFGLSSLPEQALDVLHALSACSQIFLTVHNPCQYYWGDIHDYQETLRYRQQKRQLPADTEYGHPLLASWGKQGRDYLRLLDQFDQSGQFSNLFHQQKIDIFSEAAEHKLLGCLQNDMLHLRSNSECREQQRQLMDDDQSCAFHICHSAQREVEVLHDQLLQAFEQDPTLKPRDVLVMAPDINHYAPHIQAVFGRLHKQDARYLPFVISDQGMRQNNPLLLAMEYLLTLPEARCTNSEIMDLLAIPALRRRFAIDEAELPLLQRWIQESGIRWGLDAQHRAELELPALAQNTWQFGLDRMLLGYAAGNSGAWQGIEPYDDVAGLDAVLAGKLVQLINTLAQHRRALQIARSASDWQAYLLQLLEAFFDVQSTQEQRLHLQLQQILERWVAACRMAQCDETLPSAIVAVHVLSALDEHHLSQRFFAGSINFASLMPMRAIPFRKVCLLGMSDSEYPRRQTYNDFDLMRHDYRAGDRSRREDDRYLFLEALLSAREQLYISWTGRSVNDNSERPASVLVNQLRDHIRELWGDVALQQLTRQHPLQAFSALYFSQQGQQQGFFTYAHEWQSLHLTEDGLPLQAAQQLPAVLRREQPLTIAHWRKLLLDPCAFFFNERLQVWLEQQSQEEDSNETFALDGLLRWQLQNRLLNTLRLKAEQGGDEQTLSAQLQSDSDTLAREGLLAMAGFADVQKQQLSADLLHLARQYQQLIQGYQPQAACKVRFDANALAVETHYFADAVIDDDIGNLYAGTDGIYHHVLLTNSQLYSDKTPRYKHFVFSWLVRALLNASGKPCDAMLLSPSGLFTLPVLTRDQALQQLQQVAQLCQLAFSQPLPASLALMMPLGKADWPSLFDQQASAYLHRAFATADELPQHPLWPACEALYGLFREQIDQCAEARRDG